MNFSVGDQWSITKKQTLHKVGTAESTVMDYSLRRNSTSANRIFKLQTADRERNKSNTLWSCVLDTQDLFCIVFHDIAWYAVAHPSSWPRTKKKKKSSDEALPQVTLVNWHILMFFTSTPLHLFKLALFRSWQKGSQVNYLFKRGDSGPQQSSVVECFFYFFILILLVYMGKCVGFSQIKCIESSNCQEGEGEEEEIQHPLPPRMSK